MSFEIHVTTLAGETITVNVEPSNTIDNVKDQIEALMKIPFYEQKLVIDTLVLEDDKTLIDYNIQKDNLVTLVRMNYGSPMILSLFESDGEIIVGDVIVGEYLPSEKILQMVRKVTKLHDLEAVSISNDGSTLNNILNGYALEEPWLVLESCTLCRECKALYNNLEGAIPCCP
jgi:hypothetical protein